MLFFLLNPDRWIAKRHNANLINVWHLATYCLNTWKMEDISSSHTIVYICGTSIHMQNESVLVMKKKMFRIELKSVTVPTDEPSASSNEYISQTYVVVVILQESICALYHIYKCFCYCLICGKILGKWNLNFSSK